MKEKVAKLAADGGRPVRTKPMPPRRLFGPEEKAAATEIFDECIAAGGVFGYGGPREQAYEKEFAAYLGGGLAKAVNSGTSAVLAAVAALELDCGSEIVCSPITDPGGVMPIVMMNCIPIPADTNGFSFNTGAEQIAAALTPRTEAILVGHIMGEPADMAGIMELARGRNLPVIEDCAQAHGATLRGRMVGTWGDIAAFSTMSGKHHASGAQGGLVFTRNEGLFWKARRFMDRGKSFGLPDNGQDNVMLGLNLNSSELSAAIGRVQLEKLPQIVRRRQEIAAAIADGIKSLKAVRPGRLLDGAQGSYWWLRLEADAARLRVAKDTFAAAVQAEGIPVWASYRHMPHERTWFRQRRTFGKTGCPWTCPHHTGPQRMDFALPNAEAAIASNFLIGIHENWDHRAVRDTAAALAKVERAYLKA